jgi:superfamily II DNA helicase RecQ
MFVHSENKDRHDIEQLLKSDKVVLYACVEMLESPTLAPLWTSNTCRRISAFYIDKAHTIHESRDWQPSYSRIYKLRDVVQRVA